MTKYRTIRNILLTGVLAFAGAVSGANAADFSGKTITVVVSVPAGSGGDIVARQFNKLFVQNLPGKPRVKVVNRPGGRGTVALNFVYEKGKSDGTTIYHGQWSAPAVIAGDPGVRYVPEKMGHIGSNSTYMALVVRADKTKDLKGLMTINDFIVGGRGASNAIETLGNLALRTMNVPFRYVGGFKGFSKIQAAIKADEVHAGHAGIPGFNKFFGKNSDLARPLYYYPIFDENGMAKPIPDGVLPAGTPSMIEAHEIIHGKTPSGKWYEAFQWHRKNIMTATVALLSAPGVSPDTLKAMQDAYQKTIKSEVYLTEYTKLIGAVPPHNTTKVTTEIFKNFRNVPADIKATLGEISKL